MNARTLLTAFSCITLGLGSLAACAGSEEPAVEDPGTAKPVAEAGTDSAAPKPSTTPDAAPPPPKDAAPVDTCAPTCNKDDDCKNTCAVPSSGSYCCDKAIGKCYKYTAAVCPAPVDPPDSSTPPPSP